MIAEILTGVFLVTVGSLIKGAVFPKPSAVCVADRGGMLTGAYSSGSASMGGYMAYGDQQPEQQAACGHDSYWKLQPMPQVEQPDREVRQTWNIYERGEEREDWQPERSVEHVQIIPTRHNVTNEFERIHEREFVGR